MTGSLVLLLLLLPLLTRAELVVVNGYAQGTTYQVKYADAEKRNFRKEIDSLLADFDAALSLYHPDSELSVFNASHAVRFAYPYFYPVLKKSAEIYKNTGGLFDPTVMPLVKAYGFGPGGKKGGGQPFDLDSVMQLVGFDKISFDSIAVMKSAENVELDFNAIAQGYSVDIICEFLEGKGISDYLVEVGGELRANGLKPDGNYWVIGISDPLRPSNLIATVKMKNRAMATSGNYRNHYKRGEVTYTHIVNPITGKPGTSDILSVTVFAPDAMTADGYATAFLIMGIEKLKKELSRFAELGVYAVYSTAEGNVESFVSEDLRAFVNDLP